MTADRPPMMATAAALAATAALLACGAGAGLAHFGHLAPLEGFSVFAAGNLAGAAALVLGFSGILKTATRPGRGRAVFAALIGAILLGLLAWRALPAASLPRINDITTDTTDVPQLIVLAADPANSERDMAYPAMFATAQAEAYPGLTGLVLAWDVDECFTRADQTARGLGWQVRLADPVGRRIEATDTSWLFRFVDDIVVRVRAQGDSSRVDVRSKSRDGKGDLGANAARIARFFDVLRSPPE